MELNITGSIEPSEKNTKITEPFFKKRYIQGLLLFLDIAVAYGLRTNLAVAIVAMTTNSSINPDIPILDWKETSIILSSFYWTYAALQFFSGPIAQLYGAKWYIIIGIFMNSLACVLTPIVSTSSIGAKGVMALRIIQGIFQGVMIPLVHTMLGRWAPVGERSWMTSIIYSGAGLGSIVVTAFTGVISASWSGWPLSFYVFGVVGFATCLLDVFFAYNSPAEHPTISESERKYIETSLEQEDVPLRSKEIPWKAILKSMPFWAVIVAAIGESWGSTFLTTEMPTFLSKTTKLDIESNALYSSAPYGGVIVICLIVGPIIDYLIKKNYISRTNSRRLAQVIDFWSQFRGGLTWAIIPSIFLIWLAYVSENAVLIAVLLIVSFSSTGALMCGHIVNVIDIAPTLAGVIFGIANGVGQTIAILAPVLVHYVVTDESDLTLWRIMFFLAAAIYSGSAIFFIIFLSGETQSWDHVRKE